MNYKTTIKREHNNYVGYILNETGEVVKTTSPHADLQLAIQDLSSTLKNLILTNRAATPEQTFVPGPTIPVSSPNMPVRRCCGRG